MSGLVDFERCTAVADVPLELDTGIDSTAAVSGDLTGGPALACGTADADELPKES